MEHLEGCQGVWFHDFFFVLLFHLCYVSKYALERGWVDEEERTYLIERLFVIRMIGGWKGANLLCWLKILLILLIFWSSSSFHGDYRCSFGDWSIITFESIWNMMIVNQIWIWVKNKFFNLFFVTVFDFEIGVESEFNRVERQQASKKE